MWPKAADGIRVEYMRIYTNVPIPARLNRRRRRTHPID